MKKYLIITALYSGKISMIIKNSRNTECYFPSLQLSDLLKRDLNFQLVIPVLRNYLHALRRWFSNNVVFLFSWHLLIIGKERLFLEVARTLRRKLYVGAGKLHLLRCLGLPEEDMQLFTANEMESHIHVVPLWTIASFKRMKHISNQYSVRHIINLGIVVLIFLQLEFGSTA